jgi:hypothetical protein
VLRADARRAPVGGKFVVGTLGRQHHMHPMTDLNFCTGYDWMRWVSCQAHSPWAPSRRPQTVSAGTLHRMQLDALGPMSGPQSLGPVPRAADCQRWYKLRTPSQIMIGYADSLWALCRGPQTVSAGNLCGRPQIMILCAGAHVRPTVSGPRSAGRRLSALVYTLRGRPHRL